MNAKQVLAEKTKHFIYLLEKSEMEIRSFSPEVYESFADNDQNVVNRVKFQMNSVISSYKNCTDNLNYIISNELNEPLFDKEQISAVEKALFDSGVGITEISTALINIKNAKKEATK